LSKSRRRRWLSRPPSPPLHAGKTLERLVDAPENERGVGSDPAQQRLGHSLVLREERLGQVLRLVLRRVHPTGQGLAGLNGLLGLQSELFDAHASG